MSVACVSTLLYCPFYKKKKKLFGCAVSLLLHRLFFSCCKQGLFSDWGAWASHRNGFSCGAQALGHEGFSSSGPRALEHRLSSCGTGTRSSAPRHLGSSWNKNKDWTHVSCISRRILYHWATREAHDLSQVFVSQY